MVGERLRADPSLVALDRLGEAREAALWVLARAALVTPRVRLVVRPGGRVGHRHVAVLLEVGDRAARRVDRDVCEVG